jgi:excisionase family DNA binding protein
MARAANKWFLLYAAKHLLRCGSKRDSVLTRANDVKKLKKATVNKITPINRIQVFEPVVGATKASEFLGFSAGTVRRMAHHGDLPSYAFPFGKSGKHKFKFRLSELQAFLESLKCGNNQKAS